MHFLSSVCYKLAELEWNTTPTLLAASRHNMHTIHQFYTVTPDDEQILLETCRGC
jgi:hypothetical protein